MHYTSLCPQRNVDSDVAVEESKTILYGKPLNVEQVHLVPQLPSLFIEVSKSPY